MSIAFVLRRLLLFTLLIVPQYYWMGRGCRIVVRLPRRAARWSAYVFLALAVIAMILVICDRIFYKILPGQLSPWIAPVVQLWIFTSIFVFLGVSLVRVIIWCWKGFAWLIIRGRRSSEPDAGRRSLLRQTATLAGGLPFAVAVYGYAFERLRFEIVRVDAPITNLSRPFDGLRLVQLSDIHIGDFMPLSALRRAVDMANSAAPDLIVVTGDYLTSAGDPLEECIVELSRLKAPLGTWGCNGNHEIYAGAEEMAEALFRQNGMTLLRKASAQIRWNGASLNLIGIDYQHDIPLTGVKRPSLGGAEALVRRDMCNILLSHNPNTFYTAAESGVELSLAGHTHGGQVNVEILDRSLNPARFMTDFVAGFYRLPLPTAVGANAAAIGRSACLYVNRGLGTLAVPARVGANPEITVMTLRAT